MHGDLSEFNLLYHEGKTYVIDVSQSVEHDHPRALDFLRKDLQNLTEFFRRKGVNVLSVRGLFDFVVDPSIKAGEAEEAALQELNMRAEAMTEEERSAEDLVQEEVFKNIHIPRTLDEVTGRHLLLFCFDCLFGSVTICITNQELIDEAFSFIRFQGQSSKHLKPRLENSHNLTRPLLASPKS